MESKKLQSSDYYKILKLWTATDADKEDIKLGKGILNDRYKGYVFLKRAGFRFENFRINLKNNFDASTDNYPDDIIEACRRLENWPPMYVPKAKSETRPSSNFHQGGDTDQTGDQHYEYSGNKSVDNKRI